MKKQLKAASRARKTAPVADLAPDSKRGSGVKAGAFDAFATQQTTSADTKIASREQWIEIISIQHG